MTWLREPGLGWVRETAPLGARQLTQGQAVLRFGAGHYTLADVHASWHGQRGEVTAAAVLRGWGAWPDADDAWLRGCA